MFDSYIYTNLCKLTTDNFRNKKKELNNGPNSASQSVEMKKIKRKKKVNLNVIEEKENTTKKHNLRHLKKKARIHSPINNPCANSWIRNLQG